MNSSWDSLWIKEKVVGVRQEKTTYNRVSIVVWVKHAVTLSGNMQIILMLGKLRKYLPFLLEGIQSVANVAEVLEWCQKDGASTIWLDNYKFTPTMPQDLRLLFNWFLQIFQGTQLSAPRTLPLLFTANRYWLHFLKSNVIGRPSTPSQVHPPSTASWPAAVYNGKGITSSDKPTDLCHFTVNWCVCSLR